MTAGDVRDWIQVFLSGATFLAIIVAALKVVHIAQKGVDGHEERIKSLEEDVSKLTDMTRQMERLTGTVTEMVKEVERMRNRLDLFLDRRKQNLDS